MRYVAPELVEKLKRTFPEAIESVEEFRGEVTVTVKKEFLLEFMRFLKVDKDFQMDMLVDVTAVDYPENEPRFVVVYHLRSLSKRHNLRVKCWAEGEEVPSVVDIWKTAEWTEREVYEMFGVRFTGRKLRKLLLPQKYPYFPLRKDFPLEGYEEPCEVWDWE
ncbi:NADH-quinone oxidoreductase subunit C [Phorcysia thermohydrogeniphila]|uniref:NADH-quinone oxidoreductase subunit C n=1 Tax=Phorcysia thermohydrogeniphila TaxID=936138 RepID=A0A4R1GBJ5_9BACT|nr:NADH-quinone oxidoreductase subunit C [Phorcysia thermohydrogeniphila]TCK05404.1 NADH-quinone oxidoreductase subunit C [Phorcysia thermohydrogeniphila]